MKNERPWVSALLYIPQEGCTIDLDRAQLFFFPHLRPDALEQMSMPLPVTEMCNKTHQSALKRKQQQSRLCHPLLSGLSSNRCRLLRRMWLESSLVQYCSLVAQHRYTVFKLLFACLSENKWSDLYWMQLFVAAGLKKCRMMQKVTPLCVTWH